MRLKIDELDKLFDNCANNEMNLEKYQPVKKQFIRICKYFIDNEEFKHYGINHKFNGKTYNYFCGKIEFMRELLEFFDRIVKENRYENLDKYIELLLNSSETHHSDIVRSLKVMIYKDDYVRKTPWDGYYRIVQLLCGLFSEFEEPITKSYKLKDDVIGNTKIAQFLRVYRKYLRRAKRIEYKAKEYYTYYDDPYHWQLVYMKIAPYALADCYLHDYSVECLDEVLSDIYANQYQLWDYINMNYEKYEDNYEYKEEIAKALVDNIVNQKVAIR